MSNEVIVIIPTYKKYDKLTLDEKKSLNQCYKILKNYQICLVHPFNLEINSYKKTLNTELKYELLNTPFESKYFNDITGYNDFMLSINFYTSFKEYKYILIYQLDCWVFKDELSHWCSLNYDYIGAPIFKNFGTYELGNKIDVIGNGGFSLRKINKFLEVLTWKGKILGISHYLKEFKQKRNLKSIFKILINGLGYHNNVPYLLSLYKRNLINEDVFFSYNFQSGANIEIHVPEVSAAIKFSFDRSPQYLYDLNQKQLPFGCHGWNRQDNIYSIKDKLFWENFILN